MSPEMRQFLEKEREKVKKNRIKNKPLVVMTYLFVLVFIGMFSYLIYFMVRDTDTVVAKSSNKRQDSFDKYVTRGDIIKVGNNFYIAVKEGTVAVKSNTSQAELEYKPGQDAKIFVKLTGNPSQNYYHENDKTDYDADKQSFKRCDGGGYVDDGTCVCAVYCQRRRQRAGICF